MLRDVPTVSIIIPTLNSGRVLRLCLETIRHQDYPEDRIELIIVDAGSTDDTREVARFYKADRILDNPLKTGEAGKATGVKAATGDLVALIDSDNSMDGTDWLRRMVEPFEELKIVGAEPISFTYRRQDSLITRYCALLGMNDPLCLFIGNYDRYSYVTGKWTGLPVHWEDKGSYLKIELDERNLPTIGANGFVARREALLETEPFPYLFDIDVVYELVRRGYTGFAKVKIGIIHLYAGHAGTFVRKQRRRVEDYLFYRDARLRRYPWGGVPKGKLIKFVLSTLALLPLGIHMLRGALRIEDRAWFFHLPACWMTLWVYGWGCIRGARAAPRRTDWRTD